MGTSCAPSYANLFLGGWERSVFSDDLLEPFLNHVLGWFRFINDLLVIWTGTDQLLKAFIERLNINQFNLHFTFTYNTQSISFLDVQIIKNSAGQLTTDLYRKPTAGNTLLHASSPHPCPLIRSIPYAQYLRLKRNCTEDGDFRRQANALRTRLLARGYNRTTLRKAFNKALAQDRQTLLFGPPRPKKPYMTKIITKFSTHHHQLRNILSNHWHILTDHHTLRKYIKPTPDLVFRRATSLKDRLTHSHYKIPISGPREHRGTFKCGNCPHCPWIQEGQQFLLPNGEMFFPKHSAHCSTRGVIYLMTCACSAFYVGKTIRELRQRLGDHLYASTNGKLTTVGRHIGIHHRFNLDYIRFTILEVIPEDPRGGNWDRQILKRESLWIERLNALTPPGINEAHSYKYFLE